MIAGAYTECVGFFRPGEGEDLGKHRVHRLVLGKSGHACVQINEPGQRPGEWEEMRIVALWSVTAMLKTCDTVVKLQDHCGTHLIIPKTVFPAPFSSNDLAILGKICNSESIRDRFQRAPDGPILPTTHPASVPPLFKHCCSSPASRYELHRPHKDMRLL